MGRYPNAERARADGAELARRLRETPIALTALCREYHCGYSTIHDAIRQVGKMSAGEYRRLMRVRVARCGGKTRFPPGSTPWNKGRKGYCPAGSEKGWFQQGHLRGTAARRWRPVGTILIRFDSPPRRTRGRKNAAPGPGRRWIKVRDDGPANRRWEPWARYLWRQRYGPIPAGLLVGHVDGDAMNDALDNLALMTRRENLLRLRTIRPKAMQRRAVKAAKARRKQARDERRLGARRIVTTYECRGCGTSHRVPPDPCPKCGGRTCEIVRRRAGDDVRLIDEEGLDA